VTQVKSTRNARSKFRATLTWKGRGLYVKIVTRVGRGVVNTATKGRTTSGKNPKGSYRANESKVSRGVASR
jgi:hypothetical protein